MHLGFSRKLWRFTYEIWYFSRYGYFWKGTRNGYAITAVIGKKKIMKNTKDTFLSSTFWTERVGSAAALATLNEMRKTKSWLKITKTGKFVRSEIKKIAIKNDINIQFAEYHRLADLQ